MNRWYNKYLVAKYEPLYRNRYGDMRSTAMCWGFEVGDGWFNIIDNLSYLLCNDWLHAKKHYDTIKDRVGLQRYFWSKNDDVVTQEDVDKAKAKMDELYDKTPVASQVKEKYGTLRFYVDGANEKQWAMIDFAELMSAKTCEVCGNKGKRNQNGWIVTRCREHEDD